MTKSLALFDRRPFSLIPLAPGGMALLASLLVTGVLAASIPWIGVLVLAPAVIALPIAAPSIGRLSLALLLLITPTLNPAIGQAGSGRAYAAQALILVVVLASIGTAVRTGELRKLLVPLTLAALYVVLVGLARTSYAPTLAWVYKPLQPFVVTASIAALVGARDTDRWLNLAMIGAAGGCALAALHAVFPAFDPFAFTRPDDLPFVSFVGAYERAAGGFTYPNNLGMFSGYAAITGLLIATRRTPFGHRGLAATTVALSTVTLILSASRAAAFGLLLALAYVSLRLRVRHYLAMSAAVMIVLSAGLLLVSTSETFQDVLDERVDTASGASLSLRRESWANAIQDLNDSSWILGTGVEESRLDSSWLLYLSTGGLVGASLLAALAVLVWKPAVKRPSKMRILSVALLLLLGTTAVLQDTLGQTLSSWYAAVLLGLCLAHARAAKPDGFQGRLSEQALSARTPSKRPEFTDEPVSRQITPV